MKKLFICNLLLKWHEKDKKLGAPRLALKLYREEGIKIAQSTTNNYMRQLGICSSVSPKTFKSKSSKLTLKNAPFIINRIKGLEVTSLDQVWTTDITYIRTKVVWAYLSTIIDQYSKKVIDMKIKYNQVTSLCSDTVLIVLRARRNATGVILHSDKGSQYRSKAFRRFLGKK
ncbi:MAG: DDE-type integrase/transposase/recombinase [Sphaerochaetaceae bacterium]|nr:DDE-type integrase/transposase/recombinase [Sphaerochaetaceae bacterium]